MSKRIYLARHIATMDSPVLERGAMVVDGSTIVTVGPADAVAPQHRDAEVVDLGRVLLMPGLINAHTHLELSGLRRMRYNGNFVEWILSIRPQLAPDRSGFEQRIAAAVRAGVDQSIAAGVTTVGDVSAFYDLTRPILRIGQLRVVSFGEALGLAKMRGEFERRLTGAVDTSMNTDRLRVGLSPHAPYTVDRRGYEECLWLSKNNDLPLCTHLAENKAETDFLTTRTGTFRKLWDQIGLWSDDTPLQQESPIKMAKSLGLLDHPTLLAHVNYASDDELALLAAGQASVVFCPRTHSYFGHTLHRWRDMMGRGINVCVGTDSLASAPSLNLVDDLRLLHAQRPDVEVRAIWALATTHGAKALGYEKQLGSLTPGKLADFVAFESSSDNPLLDILKTARVPVGVWINGAQVR
jgi:aminodeoxyfutalosine deaminase